MYWYMHESVFFLWGCPSLFEEGTLGKKNMPDFFWFFLEAAQDLFWNKISVRQTIQLEWPYIHVNNWDPDVLEAQTWFVI